MSCFVNVIFYMSMFCRVLSVLRYFRTHRRDDCPYALRSLLLSLTLLSRLTLFAAFVYIAVIALTDVKSFKQTNKDGVNSVYKAVFALTDVEKLIKLKYDNLYSGVHKTCRH